MRRAALAIVLMVPSLAAAADRPAPGPLGFGSFGGKEPITITSDRLEYDYRGNIVTYRGGVEVNQGQTKLKSDVLTITLAQAPKSGPGAEKSATPGAEKPAAGGETAPAAAGDPAARVQEIVATGSVRIDQGARWATGGRAVFDQGKRTVILSENPVLHDGPNEVQGDRVVVYLDEDRSVVEGGRKRVKAVLYPNQNDGKGGEPAAETPQ